MRVDLPGGFWIEREAVGYTLRKTETVREGRPGHRTGNTKEAEAILGFHAKIGHALESYADLHTQAVDTATLLAAWHAIRETCAKADFKG